MDEERVGWTERGKQGREGEKEGDIKGGEKEK